MFTSLSVVKAVNLFWFRVHTSKWQRVLEQASRTVSLSGMGVVLFLTVRLRALQLNQEGVQGVAEDAEGTKGIVFFDWKRILRFGCGCYG